MSGRQAFGHLIKVWHECNRWSHRVLPAMADLLGLGRIHNSQISNLRNGKLSSPGPEVFLTLGLLNALLARQARAGGLSEDLRQALAEVPDLLAALELSAQPLLDEAGDPLGCGELLEIFVGQRPPPPAYDWRIADDDEAARLSARVAERICDGRPWRECRERVMAAYPVDRRQARRRFAEVMAGQADYTAAELDAELLHLQRTFCALHPRLPGDGAPETPGQFLDRLRRDRDGAPGGSASPSPGAATPGCATR